MTALGLGADGAAIYHGLYGFNAVLTAIALGGLFMLLEWQSTIYAFIGAIFSAIVFAVIAVALSPIGMPALTAPIVLTTWVFLLPMAGVKAGIGHRVRLDKVLAHPRVDPRGVGCAGWRRSHALSLRLRRVKRAPPFRSDLALDNLARVRGRPLDAVVALLIPLGLLLVLDQALLGFALGEGHVGGDAHDGRHECALQNCPACRSWRTGTVSIGVRRAHCDHLLRLAPHGGHVRHPLDEGILSTGARRLANTLSVLQRFGPL